MYVTVHAETIDTIPHGTRDTIPHEPFPDTLLVPEVQIKPHPEPEITVGHRTFSDHLARLSEQSEL